MKKQQPNLKQPQYIKQITFQNSELFNVIVKKQKY